ncbi:MAG: zinc finger domain-containing protein, partial [Alphaproteobacteria bacterium]
EKCVRCWQVLPDVGGKTPGICGRCDEAVRHLPHAAE